MNLLLVDSTIQDINSFLAGINSNTKYIVYNYTDSFELLNEKISNLNINVFENVGFVFADENTPLKVFVSYNTFMSYNQEGIRENSTTTFIKNLVTNYSVKNIDFLACNLLSYTEWKNYFEFLMQLNPGLIVRASINKSGNLQIGADWILESTNEDISNLYFNDNINNWNHILDLCFGSIFLVDKDSTLNVCGSNYSGEHSTGRSIFGSYYFTEGIDNFNDVIDVATGVAHTLIIRSNGSVWACGDNTTNFALGIASTSNIPYPNFTECKWSNNGLGTVGLNSFTNASKVSCGDFTSAVITTNGNLYLCGQNTNGQLNIGSDTTNRSSFRLTNIGVPVLDIKMGSHHAIAIGSDNKLYSWGLNDNGQLGRIITIVTGTKYTSGVCKFVDNSEVTNVTKIAAGATFNLCVSNGTLYGCGNNGNGQLAVNNTTSYNYFIPSILATDASTNISNITNPLDISAGETHSVIVTSTGELRGAGNNSSFNQFGSGGVSGNSTFFRQSRLQTLAGVPTYITGVTNAICGRSHTIVKKTDNTYITCGRNSNGQLGTGNFISTTSSNPFFYNCLYSTNNGISSAGLLSNINKIALGCRSIHTIALDSTNKLLFTGGNANSNANSGHLNFLFNTNKTFQKVKDSNGSNINNIQLVKFGGNSLLGTSYVLKKDGTVWASGNNANGQLADGTIINKLSYIQCKYSLNGTTDSGPITDVISIECSDTHCLVLKKDGTVWACGSNSKGQLGDNTASGAGIGKKYFVQCKFSDNSFVTDAKAISCGTVHSMIIAGTNNTVYGCGDNQSGRLGTGDESYTSPVVVVADRLSFDICKWATSSSTSTLNSFTNALDVKCGAQHTIVLTKDFKVYGTGVNSSYQLGDAFANRNRFVELGSSIYNSNLQGMVSSIACGTGHTVFLKNDKSVWAVGANTNGQLANGGTTSIISAISRMNKVLNIPMSNAISISCYTNSTMIIDENNKIWFCGDNTTGRFGFKAQNTISAVSYLTDPSANNNYTLNELQDPNNSILNGNIRQTNSGKKNVDVSAPDSTKVSVIRNLTNTVAYFKNNTQSAITVTKNDSTNNSTSFNSLYTSIGFNSKFANNKAIYVMEPAGTIFDDYINYDMVVDSTDGIVVYFKSEDDTEPQKLYPGTAAYPPAEATSYGAYYEIINPTTVRIYTKHFSYSGVGSQEVCLLKGTKVLTPDGYKLIENLKRGDLILTPDNREIPIKFIHNFKVNGLDKQNFIPYKIEQNSIAENYPPEDTYVSGYHMIYYEGNWIQPNKCPIFKQDKSIKEIIYYHIQLDNFENNNLVVNNGLIVESLGNGSSYDSHVWEERSKNSIIIE